MKVELSGTIQEVGEVDTGTVISRGVALEVAGSDAVVFVPLSAEQCREAAGLLFREIRITVILDAKESK